MKRQNEQSIGQKPRESRTADRPRGEKRAALLKRTVRGKLARIAWKRFRRTALFALLLLSVLALTTGSVSLLVSSAVCSKTGSRILSVEELAASGETYDCILVLGCRVYENGNPSPMLSDRVKTAVSLYEAGVSDTVLMSGDHRTDAYNEVGTMKGEAVRLGVPSERIFLDHDGYSTYDSIARYAGMNTGRVVIVTQKYHLYRALYLAEKLGVEAVGVPADLQSYRGQTKRNLREILARFKDVYVGSRQPEPEVPAFPLDFSGNGDDTDESRPH